MVRNGNNGINNRNGGRGWGKQKTEVNYLKVYMFEFNDVLI